VTQSIAIDHLNVWYGRKQALKEINLHIPLRRITAIIGPSGCGKSTLLKSLNRLLDLDEQVRVDGEVLFDGVNIYGRRIDVTDIRTRIGLLAQKPFPLPLSIYDNVANGPRIHGRTKGSLDQIVQRRLRWTHFRRGGLRHCCGN
jgi:phosphate transport system ATP-binding protein